MFAPTTIQSSPVEQLRLLNHQQLEQVEDYLRALLRSRTDQRIHHRFDAPCVRVKRSARPPEILAKRRESLNYFLREDTIVWLIQNPFVGQSLVGHLARKA